MVKDEKKAVKQKAMFYWQEKLKCHIKKVPTGFVNGIIKSELENNTFYWFEDLRTHGKDERLFLDEIFDIKDYEDEGEELVCIVRNIVIGIQRLSVKDVSLGTHHI